MKQLRFMNNDLHFEVLSRLSTKDLHMLKFVSKEYRRLISDRNFVRIHSQKKESLSGFFFQERYQWCSDDIDHISYLPLEAKRNAIHSNVLDFLPEKVVVLDSCNGLICCRSILSASDPKIYICNPLNREWTTHKWLNPSKETCFSLVYDKSSPPLGDAPLDFKIVAVSKAENDDECDTEECQLLFAIYSSGNRTWNRSKEICLCTDSLICNKGVCVDGSLYWLTKGDQIIMYAPKLELSCVIPVPVPVSEFQMRLARCIGESQGKLHYVVLCEDGLQLWVLEDPFSFIWNPRFTFTIDELESENPVFLFGLASHISSHTAADMALWIDLLAFKDDVLFFRVSTYLHFFYLETRKLKRLCGLSELGEMSFNSPIVIPYTMSLVPLDSD